MSRLVNVPQGDYIIKVQPNGEIVLDTGFGNGRVRITGDLLVEGTQTTVESTNTTIVDNIILLNSGETGPGISLDEAGIRIDRGTFDDVFIVYDENINDLVNPSSSGLFAFKTATGAAKGIRTNAVTTGGGDLLLIGSGNGVISVAGTQNYETNVVDDDHITNKKYVDDAISTAFATVFLAQIGDGTQSISSVIIEDEESTGLPSVINFNIDAVTVGQVYADRWEFEEIKIQGTRIETLTDGSDLILSSPGSGSVRINDTLHINKTPGVNDALIDPLFPIDGVKIYASNEGTGKTGLYFVNENNTRDEIISKNRALLYSMLF